MSRKNLICWLAAAGLALSVLAPVQAALPPGITGAWFNPSQAGQGLAVRILAPDRALVFWYTYDAQGNPFNLYMEGRIEGRRIEGAALAPRGMRFGSFNPADLQLPRWGRLSIDFEDCNSGRMRWTSETPGFPSGEIPITRLASTYGQDCALSRPAPALGALFDVGIFRPAGTGAGEAPPTAGLAAIDPDGTLWAMELFAPGSDLVAGNDLDGDRPAVIRAELPSADSGSSASRVHASLAGVSVFRASSRGAAVAPFEGEWTVAQDGAQLVYGSTQVRSTRLVLTPAESRLVRPLRIGSLIRPRLVQFMNLDGVEQGELRLTSDGKVCLLPRVLGTQTTCRYTGRFWLTDPEAGFFDMELTPSESPSAMVVVQPSTFRGRGWIQIDGAGEAMVFISNDRHGGLSVIAR